MQRLGGKRKSTARNQNLSQISEKTIYLGGGLSCEESLGYRSKLGK